MARKTVRALNVKKQMLSTGTGTTGIKSMTLSLGVMYSVLPNVPVPLTMLKLPGTAQVAMSPYLLSSIHLIISAISNGIYSVLHDIKPGAFLTIGDTLVFLHLANVNLQHLQPGVFAGLTGLTHLELSRNNLSKIEVNVFTGLIWLRELYLFENQLSRIAEGAFEDLVQLQQLKLDRNR